MILFVPKGLRVVVDEGRGVGPGVVTCPDATLTPNGLNTSAWGPMTSGSLKAGLLGLLLPGLPKLFPPRRLILSLQVSPAGCSILVLFFWSGSLHRGRRGRSPVVSS